MKDISSFEEPMDESKKIVLEGILANNEKWKFLAYITDKFMDLSEGNWKNSGRRKEAIKDFLLKMDNSNTVFAVALMNEFQNRHNSTEELIEFAKIEMLRIYKIDK